jgi:hypothetical protein
MKSAPWAMLTMAIVAASLSAQRPVKSQPAQKNAPSLLTDKEKNIRAYMELLRSDLRKNKAQVVGLVMQLDAGEAAKFWPIYKEFEAEYTDFGNGVLGLIANYASHYEDMTPQVADQLASRLLDLEAQRNDLKRKYYEKFKEALDPISAARFLQVENQIERILDLQIASELPVIESAQRSQP